MKLVTDLGLWSSEWLLGSPAWPGEKALAFVCKGPTSARAPPLPCLGLQVLALSFRAYLKLFTSNQGLKCQHYCADRGGDMCRL
jgi:hypothetical protein